jgi:cytoskeletal protein RodZ
MKKLITLSKKALLVGLLLALGLAVLPAVSASAAVLGDQSNPPQQADPARLQQAYARLVERYNFQSNWMGKADANIARVQELINKANQRGYDASAVQAALDAFAAVLPKARVYNQQAGNLVAAHAGFDGSGNVTDPVAARETVRALQTALKTAHETMNGTGVALRKAVKAFLQAHKPASTPAP